MDKNLIPEIARMLGVELGEEFKVKGDDELTYIFADDGLKITYDGGIEIAQIAINSAFVALVKGRDEIVKMPWKPKREGTFWTFCINGDDDDDLLEVDWYVWHEDVDDLARLKAGWVYRAKEEAYAALPAVAKEVGVEYELPTSDTEAVEQWKPKNGEDYYTFSASTSVVKWIIRQQWWTNHPVDLALLAKGWVYRTKEEAEAALPKVAAEMGVEYEL